MNNERLESLEQWCAAGAPERDGIRFDMSTVRRKSECGTACCLAGAAIQFFGDWDEVLHYNGPVYCMTERTSYAANLLGVNPDCANNLFFPVFPADAPGYKLTDIDPQWAARTIRHLIATGEVDWEATREVTA